jgi:hypothetical protein
MGCEAALVQQSSASVCRSRDFPRFELPEPYPRAASARLQMSRERQGGKHDDWTREPYTGTDRHKYPLVFGLAGWLDGCLAAWSAA